MTQANTPIVAKKAAAKKVARSRVSPPRPGSVATVAAAPVPVGKLVRDSFTMPQTDYALIAILKQRSLDAKRATKKSELLRAGLHALAAMQLTAFRKALAQLAPLKPGRPKKAA